MKIKIGIFCYLVGAFLPSFASASDQSSWMELSKSILIEVAEDLGSDKNLKQYYIDSIRLEFNPNVSGIQITPVALVINTTSGNKFKNSCHISYKIIPTADQKRMERVERIYDSCDESPE